MIKQFRYILLFLFVVLPHRVQATDLSAFGEFLYWKVSEETASIWANDITFPAPNTTVFSGKNIDFSWKPGFRVGIGYQSESRFLDANLCWTHFKTSEAINYAIGAQLLTPEFFSGFISGNLFFGANIDWQFVMNVVDFNLSHALNITPSLCITPAIGVKGAAINQAINSQWNAFFFTATEVVNHDFHAMGPSFGVDGKWTVYDNLNLVGDVSASFLWGNWDIDDRYTRPEALFGLVPATTITSSMDSRLGVPMLEGFVGVEWVHQATETMPNFTLRLGYEMQYWANQLRLMAFQILPVHGDLTLEGATCGISVPF